jgi:hypothetical protein
MTPEEAETKLRDSVVKALKTNPVVNKLTEGRVFVEGDTIELPCVVVTLKDGDWLGRWPDPGERKQVQRDITVTSMAGEERLSHGLIKACQKALAPTPQHSEGIVNCYILTGTPPISVKEGVHSRGDVFGVIATVEG